MTLLTSQEIQAIIPHRYPFLLVDRVSELDLGHSIRAHKNLTINEAYFQGHFPEEPVFPGVLMIEALAQAGAINLLQMEEFRGQTVYLGGVDKVRFRRKVLPGEVLDLFVQVTRLRGSVGQARAQASVAGEVTCQADLTFVVGTADHD